MVAVRSKKSWVYHTCLTIIRNKFFSYYLVPGMIMINTGVLAADRYPIAYFEELVLERINFGFYFFFLSEVLLKLGGLGFKTYFDDAFNIFDIVLIGVSTIDTIIQIVLIDSPAKIGPTSGSLHDILAAIKAFRLLRVFKLAATWKRFEDLLKTVWKTLKDISTFTIFLFLFTFIYALLGMEIFAFSCSFTPDNHVDLANGDPPLCNFDTFYEAFLTVFVMLTGDRWTLNLINFYRCVGSAVSLFFFVSFMIIGQYMLLNLFLAILL